MKWHGSESVTMSLVFSWFVASVFFSYSHVCFFFFFSPLPERSYFRLRVKNVSFQFSATAALIVRRHTSQLEPKAEYSHRPGRCGIVLVPIRSTRSPRSSRIKKKKKKLVRAVRQVSSLLSFFASYSNLVRLLSFIIYSSFISRTAGRECGLREPKVRE